MTKQTISRPTSLTSSRRVGRGGKRGKTSGKGMKGQKSRTGNSTRPELRDIIKKYPKRRGHGKNRARTVVPNRAFQTVNFDQISRYFEEGAEISPRALVAHALVRRQGGRTPKVKVLARGELSKKFTFKGLSISQSAVAAIQKAGGAIVE